jgi:hypothetical protein
MKLLSALIVSAFAVTAFASEPGKKPEEVKKPAAAVTAPATPKEMPKVEKPKTKAEKEAEAKAKADATKSATPAPAAKEAPKAADTAKK